MPPVEAPTLNEEEGFPSQCSESVFIGCRGRLVAPRAIEGLAGEAGRTHALVG